MSEESLKKLSQEFSRTENCILGALARLDDFFMNPLIQGHSGTAPKTSRNASSLNQGTNEDDSQSDLLETGIFHSETTRNSGPEKSHDMLTRVHQEVTYCSPSTSSVKQKQNRSTSQPQSENPCDGRSRPNFVGPSAVGKQQQFCKFP